MLVLSRKLGEKIVLPSLNIAIQVVGVKGRQVRLGIVAPPDISVMRAELPDRTREWSAEGAPAPDDVAADVSVSKLGAELRNRLKATAAGLGLMHLQLDAGQPDEAGKTLTYLQDDFQLLLHGLEGELEKVPAQPVRHARALRKALLVEDNSNERELLAGFLRHSGLEVDTSPDGADALQYLGSHRKPDVILLDMGLPLVDGPTMVRRIRGNPNFAGIKIFGVSGHLPEEFDLESGPRGIDRWFHKPVDPAVIMRDLEEELCRNGR